MLINLHVKNIALIDEIDVEFTAGLNILTGETGAGKSILLGAVNLALGKKVTGDIIGKFASFGLVELIFQVKNEKVQKALEEKDIILEDDQVILTRKIMPGRSVCKINGETCTASQMKEAASLLMDIHGQQEHQKLLSQEYQLSVLDGFAASGIKDIKAKTARAYEDYQQLTQQLSSYTMDEEQRLRELSFIEFEIQEIEEAALEEEEDVKLEMRYKKLQNARKISEGLKCAHDALGYDHPGQAGEQVSKALREVAGIKDYDEQITVMHDMLLDIESMLNDLNLEISSYLGELVFSEGEFRELDQRLNSINSLKAKYGASIWDILDYQRKQQERQQELLDFDARKETLKRQQQQAEETLLSLYKELTHVRMEHAIQLEEQLTRALQDLNFMDVDFKIMFTAALKFSKNGNDSISFYISTNPGEAKKPFSKVLSGGELSRVMLAVKALIADMEDTGTQIFDEIDAGISGRTAQMVAEKLELISRERQILCITHLPQIAAMSDRHFEIRKNMKDQTVTTQIFPLQEAESMEEIARILGGAKITDRVRNNAKEMKDLAQVHKNTRVKL